MQVPIRKPDKRSTMKTDPQITAGRVEELRLKLEGLKKARIRVAQQVKDLSEGGDFSENAGYQAAKGQLRGINQGITDIEEQLKRAVVITAPADKSSVQLGHRVTLEIGGRRVTYQILGSSETDPAEGVISHNSPIGAALMGHRVGDRVTFSSATKIIDCTILAIE